MDTSDSFRTVPRGTTKTPNGLPTIGKSSTLKIKGEDWRNIVEGHVKGYVDLVDRAGKGRKVTTVFNGTPSEYKSLMEQVVKSEGVPAQIAEMRSRNANSGIISVKFEKQEFRLEIDLNEGAQIKGFFAGDQLVGRFTELFTRHKH